MTRALVCIGTYNEIETLPELVDRILERSALMRDRVRNNAIAEIPEIEILIVDDNSPDGTGAWCKQFAAHDRRLQVLHREGKLGLGSAMIAALQYAIDHEYDVAVTMDADLSHDPSALGDLLAALEHADVVIGSRYIPGGTVESWPMRRRLLSRAANLAARSLLALRARDCSSGYRAYRTEALRRIDLSALRASGYLFYEEVLAHLQSARLKIVEIPITFVDRQRGRSKIGFGELFRSGWTLLWLAWQQRGRSRIRVR